ncbi:hypothetical protein ACTXP8_27335, partial [Klebsiella pneumoniae]|uniref:hypothetical protein n=1 Tax=Klebsiella pneumoniae TaxID=573 RepID=UPI003FD63DC7
VLEAQGLTFQVIAGEPVVAAGVALGALGREGQRNRRAADHRIITDPLGDIGDIVLQCQRFHGAARGGQRDGEQREGVAVH